MKLSAILGKRQLILASLVLILGVAVYLNWQFTEVGEDFAVTGKVSSETTESAKNYGDTTLVNNPESSALTDDYFAKTKLSRTKARDEAETMLSKMLKDSKLTETEKTKATNQAMQLAKTSDNESKIENLVKAKGFAECVAYIDGENADVIVKTDKLTPEGAAQIKDIVLTESSALNVKIVEVK